MPPTATAPIAMAAHVGSPKIVVLEVELVVLVDVEGVPGTTMTGSVFPFPPYHWACVGALTPS
jgi:hypothetical protein